MSSRLIWRFLIPSLTIAIIGSSLLTLLFIFFQTDRRQDRVDTKIGEQAAILAPLLDEAARTNDRPRLTQLLQSFSLISGVACAEISLSGGAGHVWPDSGCAALDGLDRKIILPLQDSASTHQLTFGLDNDFRGKALFWQTVGFAGLIAAALCNISIAFIVFFRRFIAQPLRDLEIAFQSSKPGAPAPAIIHRKDEIGRLAEHYNDMAAETRMANNQLRVQESELQRINRHFGDSVIYASQIQRRLLPDRHQLARHLGEHALLWQPKDTVGGDLLWVGSRGEVDFLIFFDCTGHGVPGAMMTMVTIGVVDQIMNKAEADASPARLLKRLHTQICKAMRIVPGQPAREGLDCAIIRMDHEVGSLHFCGASIDLFEIGPGGPVQRWRGARRTLGYQLDSGLGKLQTLKRPMAGRTFMLASDGLTSQIGAASGKVMGTGRMLYQLNYAADRSPAGIVRMLARYLKDWQGDEDRRDDVSILAFRPENRL